MWMPTPKPAKRAKVWRGEIRIGNRWYKVWFCQRIGALHPYWESTWQDAMKFATDWEGTKAAHKEQRKRVRLHAEIV